MGIKFRLIVMNFLNRHLGSWLISLGAIWAADSTSPGLQIGGFFATMGASLFMPAVMGIIADRWIPAQKLLGICHLISGAFVAAASDGLCAFVQLHAAGRDVLHADDRAVNSMAYNA
ncbi:MAG: hypothetical protein ACLRMJ_08085 [Alistipes finegoldii]